MNMLMMKNERAMSAIRAIRPVVSFGMLCAVLTGILTGGHEFGSVDPRMFGAGVGATLAIGFKLFHLI